MSCKYRYSDHGHCKNDADESGLCFWHNPKADKSSPFIKRELEKYLLTSSNLEGFQLSLCDLHGIKLMQKGQKEGVNLSYADLYRTNLSKAHLFNINLQHSSLMKTDLSGTNLNLANLRETNMLGTIFSHTKIEHVKWGDKIVQEKLALKAMKKGMKQESLDSFEQAEEIYRNLRKISESRGNFEFAGHFFHKEMVMRRFQLKPFSLQRIISKTVDLFCGYGERPMNVILFSLFVILTCAILYFFVGIQGPETLNLMSFENSVKDNVISFLNALYFSVVTFTTLGYGDLTPIGFSRLIAASEAFIGSFTLALFVVVFVKKMTR